MKNCIVDNCFRKYYARGYCRLHYGHKRIHGRTFSNPLKGINPKNCIVDGCARKPKSKGYCDRHYQQITYKGSITGDPSRTKFDLNEAVFDGGVVNINLYNCCDEIVSKAIVDQKTYPAVKKFKWRIDASGYVATGKHPNITTIAHVILGIPSSHKTMPDHINRNKLDNRMSNLRLVNKSQNAINSKKRTDNTSGIKGVSWDSTRSKWTAYIQVDEKRISLGRFTNKNDAIRERQDAEKKYYKEFNPI